MRIARIHMILAGEEAIEATLEPKRTLALDHFSSTFGGFWQFLLGTCSVRYAAPSFSIICNGGMFFQDALQTIFQLNPTHFRSF